MIEAHETKKTEAIDRRQLDKVTDLLIRITLPVLGLCALMLEYSLLIQPLTTTHPILLSTVTAILGFVVVLFVGRSFDMIWESTFFKLFLRIIDQLPLITSIADR